MVSASESSERCQNILGSSSLVSTLSTYVVIHVLSVDALWWHPLTFRRVVRSANQHQVMFFAVKDKAEQR